MFVLGLKVRKIVHVDLDAFFISVERALDSDLKGKPVVVGGEPGFRGVVASASYEARAYGLRAGMPLTQAYRLCPQAVFLKGNFLHYRDASAKFMSIVGDFTPYLEVAGIDEAYLDLTGFESIYGSIWNAALRMKERISGKV